MTEAIEPIICTPIGVYENRRGARVHVLGTVHAGTPWYYEGLRSYVGQHERRGGIVHYEQIIEPSQQELATAPAAVLDKFMYLGYAQSLMYKWVREAGLVTQADHLKPKPNWENHDGKLLHW